MADKKPTAKADDSHDGRYTHPTASPSFSEPSPFPKWVTPADGGPAVIVKDPDEEAIVTGVKETKKGRKDAGFMRLGTMLLLALLFVLAAVFPVLAQTTVTQTTLSSALAAPTQGSPALSVLLASATGVSAPTATQPGSVLYVDQEAMRVQSLSGTTAQVQRGQLSTAAAAHASGAIVFAGPSSGTLASPFVSVDPNGVCVAASQPYTLQINPRSGNISACTATTTGARWQRWSSAGIFESAPRAVVAGNTSSTSGGYTVKITDYIVALSTTGTGSGGVAAPVTTFTLPTPVGGLAGKILVLKDESGGVGATTFINIMGTIDGATSAQLKTAYGSLTVYAGSGGWFRLGAYAIGPN